jgi:hypothetical protein
MAIDLAKLGFSACCIIRNCWTEMLARSLGYITILDPNVKCNFIQHCFCDLRSHFEALESVLLKKKLSSTPRKNMIKLTLVPQNELILYENAFQNPIIFATQVSLSQQNCRHLFKAV